MIGRGDDQRGCRGASYKQIDVHWPGSLGLNTGESVLADAAFDQRRGS
jgi:hypothetical protein